MSRFTSGWARACAGHPWRTITIWLLLLLAGLLSVATLLAHALTTNATVTANVEGKMGFDLLDERLPSSAVLGGEVVIVRSEVLPVSAPQFRRFVNDLATSIRETGKATQVTSVYDANDQTLVSPDLHAALLLIRLMDSDSPETTVEDVIAAVRAADKREGFAVAITGVATLGRDYTLTSQRDLRRGELYFGMPAALLVLLLVFGAVVAALVPLLMALVCIPISIGLAALVGQLWSLSFFITNMVFAMGLALGIDYSLFVVSRYREERRRGLAKTEAIVRAADTASVAVIFSGVSFTVALTGLLLVPDTTLRSLALGAIIVGLVTIAATMTLLPALLGLLGDKVDTWRLPWSRRATHDGSYENRRWLAVVRFVMRRPGAVLGGAVGLLLLFAIPVLNLHTGQQGIATLPDRLVAKQGYLALQRDFPSSGRTDPARIVIPGDADSARVRETVSALQTQLALDSRFATNRVLRYPAQDLTVLDVALPGNPQGDAAKTALRDLRARIVHPTSASTGVPAYVTGMTAFSLDYADLISTWLPRVIGFVLALTFLLLTVVFRSLVLSLKAVLLNLLSVGAAYGLLVLVFQEGFGAGILGLTQVETVEPWVPVFLFSVLFALSMDYHVFLLTRIREKHAQTGDTKEAVAHGIASTGQLITGAALIIVVVFIGFATGDFVGFQQMGFGVAVALLIDATVVRSLVVPSAMVLLGSRNWWLPNWLQWLPELQVGAETISTRAHPASRSSADA